MSNRTDQAEAPLTDAIRFAARTSVELGYAETEKTFDPKQVYGDAPNPTVL